MNTPPCTRLSQRSFLTLMAVCVPDGLGQKIGHIEDPWKCCVMDQRIFGPDGQPIALVPVDDPGTPDVDEGAPDKVRAFLEKWVK